MNFEAFELLMEMTLGFSFVIIVTIITLIIIEFMNKRDEKNSKMEGK